MSTLIHVRANIYDIVWDTKHKGTTLPHSVNVNFKTTDTSGFMHQAIIKDLEARYLIKVSSFSKRGLTWKLVK